MSLAGLGGLPLPQVEVRLINRTGDKWEPNERHETDARTALTRAVAEYLSQVSAQNANGRLVQFRKVFHTWAEPEDQAVYPSAAVYGEGTGNYDASKLTPGTSNRMRTADGNYLMATSEYTLDVRVDIWATDPPERMALVSMLEDEMSPVDFMHGVLLELPWYHNARASIEMASLVYLDEDLEAIRRYRRAQMVVRGRVPVLRVVHLPMAKPKAVVKVVGADEKLG